MKLACQASLLLLSISAKSVSEVQFSFWHNYSIIKIILVCTKMLSLYLLLTDIVLEAVIALAIISVLLLAGMFFAAGGWAYCVSQRNNIDYAPIYRYLNTLK